jgi:hypothetical protein
MSFKNWVADSIMSKKHIEEVMKKVFRKELMILRDKYMIDIDDLSQDCWIFIREHSETRGDCKEHLQYYSGKIISSHDEERFARQTTKIVVSWYMKESLRSAKEKSESKKRYKEHLMLSEKITEEKYDSDTLSDLIKTANLTKDESIILLWHNHLITDDMAMEMLKLSSRKSLYNRLYKALDKLSGIYHKKEFLQPKEEKTLSLSELLFLMNKLKVAVSIDDISNLLDKEINKESPE